jgi:hypothetical protein
MVLSRWHGHSIIAHVEAPSLSPLGMNLLDSIYVYIQAILTILSLFLKSLNFVFRFEALVTDPFQLFFWSNKWQFSNLLCEGVPFLPAHVLPIQSDSFEFCLINVSFLIDSFNSFLQLDYGL